MAQCLLCQTLVARQVLIDSSCLCVTPRQSHRVDLAKFPDCIKSGEATVQV